MSEKLEELLTKLREVLEAKHEWWRYERLKEMGGYIGICMLMTLYAYGPFDRATQWIKTSRVPKSTFFMVRKELRRVGLVKGNGIELTGWGEKTCKFLESSPVISKARFLSIIEDCKGHKS